MRPGAEGAKSWRHRTPRARGGDGTDGPVGVISMDKFLPGQHPTEPNGAGQNLSVAR